MKCKCVKAATDCISADFAEYNVDGGKEDLFDINEGERSSHHMCLMWII